MEGIAVGAKVGSAEGSGEGLMVGEAEGSGEGLLVGEAVGGFVGVGPRGVLMRRNSSSEVWFIEVHAME